MELNLEPKQSLAFHTPATEVLYGGAKGGGKSFLFRVSALRWCSEVPGIQVFVFRRTLADLRRNHMEGPKSFNAMLSEHLKSGHVKWHAQNNQYLWWNGAIINLCYCESERDVENYQGAEMHVLMPDEATHYTEYQYRYLRAQVRLAGLAVPEKYKGRLPRIELGANPGSVGHAWVKRTFISPAPALQVWRAPKDEGGMLRQFIPARLTDNPHLTRDDPEYADRLRGMGSDSLVKAMLEGDWDIVAGQAFEKLSRSVHALVPFPIPDSWLKFRSLDWGSSKPFSLGCWAVVGETTYVRDGIIIGGNDVTGAVRLSRGAIIRFDEWYGWTGKPDEGARMEAGEVAQGIKKRERDHHYAYTVADPAMWKVDGGPSTVESFLKNGVVLRRGDNSRHAGYMQMRERIKGDEDGPMFYVFKTCHDGFWRTVPDLVLDERHTNKGDDVDCWVAGTRIATPAGDRAIEDIRVGDLVHTPIGPRRVRKSYVSGPSETVWARLSDGGELRGTPHHKIAVMGRGLVPLSMLECHDILIERTTTCDQRLLYIEALLTAAIRGVFTTRRTGRFSPMAAWRSIVRFGLMSAALFQKAFTFITAPVIMMTTQSAILNACRAGNMSCTTTSTETTSRLRNGNGRPAETEGIRSGRTSRNAELIPLFGHLRAVVVGKLSKRAIRERDTARKNAQSRGNGFTRAARYAGIISDIRNTKRDRSKPVHIVAVGSCEEKTPVYNLTVDQAHLFYANGILSSNTDQEDHCYDDTRYGCMSRPWITAKEKAAPKPDRWLRFEEREEETWRTA